MTVFSSREFEEVYDRLRHYLLSVDPSRSFVAMDIDNTLIKTHMFFDRVIHVREGIKIYDLAKALDIEVVLITARSDLPDIHNVTAMQLRSVGIDNVDIYFQPVREITIEATSEYKFNTRRAHEFQNNKRCVCMVGDMWSDLFPLTYEDSVMLDNKYRNYFVLETSSYEYSVKLPSVT